MHVKRIHDVGRMGAIVDFVAGILGMHEVFDQNKTTAVTRCLTVHFAIGYARRNDPAVGHGVHGLRVLTGAEVNAAVPQAIGPYREKANLAIR